MQRMPAVSRPAWMLALSGAADRVGAPRRSPVEIIATMGTYVTRTPAAGVSGLRTGPFGRWAGGVTAMREDCAAFARHWQAHNDQVLAADGPLWVMLGDSTAQGLGPVGLKDLSFSRTNLVHLTGTTARENGWKPRRIKRYTRAMVIVVHLLLAWPR
jgi:hypothetical protein